MSTWIDGTSTSRTSASLESTIVGYAPYVNVKTYGALGDNTTDDSSAIQAAIDYIESLGGGTVYFPPGTYRTNSMLTLPENCGLRGAGQDATIIRRMNSSTTHILIDISGADEDNFNDSVSFTDLSLHGGDQTAGNPVVRGYHVSRFRFQRVRISACPGPLFQLANVFDSYFSECRFDFGGSSDGTLPGWVITNRVTDTDGAFGYSEDGSNQIYFINCVQESFRQGGLIARNYGGASGSTQKIHSINFLNFHSESQNITAGGTIYHMKFEGGNYCRVRDSYFVSIEQNADQYGVWFTGNSTDCLVSACHFASTLPSCNRAAVTLDTTDNIHIEYIDYDYDTADGPTVALVEFQNTNTRVSWNQNRFRSAHGGADRIPYINAAPTSWAHMGANGIYFYPDFWSQLHPSNSNGTAALTNEQEWACPVFLNTPWRIDGLAIEVTSAGGTGSVIRLGVRQDYGGRPQTLIYDAGASGSGSSVLNSGLIDGTNVSVQTVDVDISGDSGLYWFTVAAQGNASAPTVRTVSTSAVMAPIGSSAPTTGQSNLGFRRSTVTGALPTSFSSTTAQNTAVRLWARHV